MIKTERVPTGIQGLDQLIEGGLPKGRSFLVTGDPGTGKTIFALQFLLEGLKRGEKCIFVTADEGPIDVMEQAASLGWDLEPYVESKSLAILNAGAYLSSLPGSGKERQFDVQKAVGDLASFVNQIGAERMVLDPAGPFVLLRDTATRIQDQTRLLIKLLRSFDEDDEYPDLLRGAAHRRAYLAWYRRISSCRRHRLGNDLAGQWLGA